MVCAMTVPATCVLAVVPSAPRPVPVWMIHGDALVPAPETMSTISKLEVPGSRVKVNGGVGYPAGAFDAARWRVRTWTGCHHR